MTAAATLPERHINIYGFDFMCAFFVFSFYFFDEPSMSRLELFSSFIRARSALCSQQFTHAARQTKRSNEFYHALTKREFIGQTKLQLSVPSHSVAVWWCLLSLQLAATSHQWQKIKRMRQLQRMIGYWVQHIWHRRRENTSRWSL